MLVSHLVEVTLSISHRQTPTSLTPDTAGVCKLSIHDIYDITLRVKLLY